MSKVYTLLSQTDRHPKMIKNGKVGVVTRIMHLAPADRSGYEVCPMRSPGCTEACLNTAGKQWPGRNDKQAARVRRTKFFFEERSAFMRRLVTEINNARKMAAKSNALVGIRLNGTSDFPFEKEPCQTIYRYSKTEDCVYFHPNIMGAFPDVCFYDYTKRPNRRDLPPNYRLTFSRSENNERHCLEALDNGMNVAVVFRTPKDWPLPDQWHIGGRPLRVIDGDEHDWRYGDYDDYPGECVIVGLRAKGKAKADKTGFVIQI